MDKAVEVLKSSGVIAYPTEAVYGLGCNPDCELAVTKLLQIKQRPVEKGLILIAGEFDQLKPYIDQSQLTADELAYMQQHWPNGISFIVPASQQTASFITGQFNTVAVRVTDQPDVVAICRQFNKPLVSTSANLSGEPPATSWQQLSSSLIERLDYIVKGKTLGFSQPSKIINIKTKEVIRS